MCAARISATLPPPSSQAPAAAATAAADSGEPEPEPQAAAFPPLTNETIREAVEAFCEEGGGRAVADFLHSPQAEAKYGPVVAWDVSAVTSMRELFKNCAAFDHHRTRDRRRGTRCSAGEATGRWGGRSRGC